MRTLIRAILIIFTLYFLPVGCMVVAHNASYADKAWWELKRDSSKQAPDPAMTNDAIIQVYSARAARWRGAFGVHTWFATKRTDEQRYTRLEVIGYQVYWGRDAVRIHPGSADRYWFGNRPELLREIRGGEQVNALIKRLHAAARNYPYNSTYHVWPGPNSNTFAAWVGRAMPELSLELPSNALGKDYVPINTLFARTPSGTGVQLSLGGYAGLLAGWQEGLEINLLGLTAGVDLNPPALKLPGIGRLGFSDTRRFVIGDLVDPNDP